MKVKLFTSK